MCHADLTSDQRSVPSLRCAGSNPGVLSGGGQAQGLAGHSQATGEGEVRKGE